MTCICSCVFGCAVFALSGTVVGAFTTQGLPARKYDRDCDQRDERPEGNYERRFQKFTDTVFGFQGATGRRMQPFNRVRPQPAMA